MGEKIVIGSFTGKSNLSDILTPMQSSLVHCIYVRGGFQVYLC